MDRLGQDLKLMSLGTGLFQQVSGSCLAGEEQDLAAGKNLANTNCGLDAVHIRHNDIADDQVRTAFTRAVDCGGSRVDGRSIESVLIQNDRQSIGDHPLIVHYQYTWLGWL